MEYSSHTRYPLRKPLLIFLSIIGLIILIGFIFIYSSSSIYALERFKKPHYFVIRQGFGLLVGLAGLIIGRFLPLWFIKKCAPLFFIGSLLLTLATNLPGIGVSIHGSRRWLSLAGVVFQPSELLKIALIVYLATIFAKKQFTLRSFTYGYLPFLCILGVTAGALMRQPDFGQTVTISIMAFLLFFIAHVTTTHLLATLLPLIPLAALLVYIKPYRFHRILIFLNPWQDPQGAGFQIIQSLIAIGSGGLFGLGLANSKQKFFYLPMQHTDFILSIIAEETGFVGMLILAMLYGLFLYFGLKLACGLTDPFSFYLVLGFVLLISIQTLVNMAVVTGLLPTKGLGLPFISYGSTSLACSLWMVGLVINCVHAAQEHEAYCCTIPVI